MSTPPGLETILTNILNAIQTIIGEVASVIAENASTIATLMVLGGLVMVLVRYGSRIFRGITGWFRAFF